MAKDITTVGKNSLIYITAEILMKGMGFLLIPLYTRLLTPTDYGILSVVTAITSLLGVFYLLGLPAAINRFYFEDPQNEKYVKGLWGTNITFILIISFLITTFFMLFGNKIFPLFIDKIPFFPYVFLGLIATATMPFFNMYQATLKTRQIGKKYGYQHIVRFFCNIALILLFVVVFRMKAEGPLLAMAITGLIFFTYTAFSFGRHIKWGINLKILKKSLFYSLPLLPHALAGWIMTLLDRLFLNKLKSTASVGLYNVGFTFGNLLNLITAGFNEAYTPYFMQTKKGGDALKIKQLIRITLTVVGIYVVLGICMALFSRELITFMTTKAFYDSWIVTPFIAFSNVLQGVYRIFVNPLFFNLKGTKYVSLGTFSSAGLNIGFLFIFIPKYGIIGAGLASLLSSLLSVVLIGVIAHRIEPIDWEYGRILSILFIGIFGSFLILFMEFKRIFFHHLYFKIPSALLLGTIVLIISNGGIMGLKKNVLTLKDIIIIKSRINN